MEKKPEQIHADGWLKDLPPLQQTQSEGFKPDEMIVCSKCGRLSPPNRLKCFYCNGELSIAETQFIKPNLRKLEIWEKGFNIIYLPAEPISDEATVSEIAKLLKIEEEEVQKIFAAGKPLPIARAESNREAEIVAKGLEELGARSFVISDDKLKAESFTQRRLRRIEFLDEKLILILFNADEIAEIAPEGLRLIVSGGLFERKIESIERHKRKDENKILETTELSTDEILIDIYNGDDPVGYRIESKGFDFSCLGEEKHLLAKENMERLTERLRAFAPGAKFDDDYRRVRAALGQVWEVEQTRDSKGFQKKGLGKFNLENVTTVNNLLQFTKYSRLQWHLL